MTWMPVHASQKVLITWVTDCLNDSLIITTVTGWARLTDCLAEWLMACIVCLYLSDHLTDRLTNQLSKWINVIFVTFSVWSAVYQMVRLWCAAVHLSCYSSWTFRYVICKSLTSLDRCNYRWDKHGTFKTCWCGKTLLLNIQHTTAI